MSVVSQLINLRQDWIYKSTHAELVIQPDPGSRKYQRKSFNLEFGPNLLVLFYSQ